ncbi:MAG: hypothetical protein AB1Z98_38575 [Nannocystaceae bacterium]
MAGCILPDRGIRTESDVDNPGAVRIIETIPIVPALADACREAERSDPDYAQALLGCPQLPPTLPQGLVGGGPFCSCPGRDRNTLPEFSLYAEDPDRRGDEAEDTLYAVALLDLDPVTRAPQTFVAYPEQLNPGAPGNYITDRNDIDDNLVVASQGREDNGIWRFSFGRDGGEGTDLCNDDDGQTLAPGLHNLTIMVTDRPFFQPVRLDEDGEVVLGTDGRPELLRPQYGMPDLAIGATWAVANYVFECQDAAEVPELCDCVEEAP